MGIVTSVTPSLSSLSTAIKRSHDSKNIKPLSCSKSIPLRDYHGKALLPAFVKFKPYTSLKEAALLRSDKFAVLDIVWISCFIVKPIFCNWAGYMQSMFEDKSYHGKSSIHMLPLIDHNPSDPACIYSTLMYI